MTAEPVVRATVMRLRLDDFAEEGGTTGFSVLGLLIDRNAFVSEARLDWRIAKDTTLSYSGQIGAWAQEHAVKDCFNLRFETR